MILRPSGGALASAGAICVAFVGMLAWTWGTWPDVIVDFGRELYVPFRLVNGAVLYRDIAWLNGPLSPYLNAAWFDLFGVGLRSLVAGNLTLLVVLVWLVFRVASSIASRLAATFAALTFVAMFAFSVSNYNYLTPYSHELTHGVLLSFAAILCFSSFLRGGRLPSVVGTGLALGLVFLTKAEVFLALAAALSIGIAAAFWTDAIPRERRWQTCGWLLAAALAPVLIAVGLFVRVLSLREALVAAAGSWRYVLEANPASLVFYQRLAGLDALSDAVRATVSSALVYVGVFGGAALASVLASRRSSDRRAGNAMSFATGFCGVGVSTQFGPWGEAARPLTLILLILCARVAWNIRRPMVPLLDHVTGLIQLTFATFALCLLARMGLNAAFYRYGFVLAMPATLTLVVALLDWIPARLTALGWEGTIFRGVGVGAWTMLIVAHLIGTTLLLGEKTFKVGEREDRFYADARATAVSAAVREIENRVRPDQTLLVLPEGIMLNYLTRRVTPTPFVNFMPVELMVFGESRMLAALQLTPPDYVALVHKDTSEYGVRFFGRDYGQGLLDWVNSRYQPIHTWGSVPLSDDQFGVRLLERIQR